jgi:SAM-dependent methyltransferase
LSEFVEFSAEYYQHHCGEIPYTDKNVWSAHFGRLADRIVAELQPQSVVDIGCGFGYLVGALRERGVDAQGFDISAYAMGQLPPSAVGHCWQADLLTPPLRHYDLAVCIEVFEHLPAEKLPMAVENLCNSADRLLFSSSPNDYSEASHRSVYPPEFWVRMLAQQGFVRQFSFSTLYISQWAQYFIKLPTPLPQPMVDSVVGYEQQNWQLRLENLALRKSLQDARPLLQRVWHKVRPKRP